LNFLAHFHLSQNNSELAIGNYLGDFARQKEIEHLSKDIVLGWKLHRFIDEFTDSHPVVLNSKEKARTVVKKYAPVLVDIYYDYFLANHWNSFSANSLRSDTDTYYKWMQDSIHVFPKRALRFYQYAIQYDIFYAYRTYEGLEDVLKGMSHRASFESNLTDGVVHLKKYRSHYEEDFLTFYPELQKVVKTFLSEQS
jgi:acyl carrier protein phosphodiesterase